EDQCESALLSLALQCAKRRVVVKRNRRSPDLAGAKPTFKLQGSKSRFDVYCC
ncbi:MAG TPA: SAM-dependent methyltransferase, partial [Gammaproteobacteria bacterium]|nr:SAM-dependent methyltransferase [Gammaproteobacteria bacterium]